MAALDAGTSGTERDALGGAGLAGAGPPSAGQDLAQRGTWRPALSAFARNRVAITGLGLVSLVALFCFAGPVFYRTNQVTVQLNLATLPPGNGHPLGTDPSGYDVLGRLMLGGQSSLELGLAVSLATTIVGTLYGAISRLERLGLIEGRIVEERGRRPYRITPSGRRAFQTRMSELRDYQVMLRGLAT